MPRTSTAPRTIECPKCHQQLPQWAQQCQFCGAQLFPGQVRNVDAATYTDRNKPTWTEAAYIVISWIIVLQGLFQLLQAFNVIPNAFYAIGGGTFLGVFGAIQMALGFGMVFYQTWAQFVMKWILVLNIPNSLLGILMGLIMLSDKKEPNYLLPIVAFLNFFFTCFALYIVNKEADV